MKPALAIAITTWLYRLMAIGLFLLWGAFFVEHLSEWFLHPAQGFPPYWVWFQQLMHLAMLVGLLLLLRWELLGAVTSILGAMAFFLPLAFILSTRPGAILGFLAVTLVPGLLALICWFARLSQVVEPLGPIKAGGP